MYQPHCHRPPRPRRKGVQTIQRLAEGGVQARIVDDDGQLLAPRGVGVIEVRGEPVTPGYITKAGFVAAQDARGWYDTGDLGYLTEHGHVVVCGRVKDVIIMGGRKVYPAISSARRAGCPACVQAARWPYGCMRGLAGELRCCGRIE